MDDYDREEAVGGEKPPEADCNGCRRIDTEENGSFVCSLLESLKEYRANGGHGCVFKQRTSEKKKWERPIKGNPYGAKVVPLAASVEDKILIEKCERDCCGKKHLCPESTFYEGKEADL